jgi:hypothetical protein
MSEGEWFKTFCGNIIVSNKDDITRRNRAITKRLNYDFWGSDSEINHSRYVGSYGRNTAIDGISDIDFLFQLPGSVYSQYDNYQGNGQSALLQSVKNSLLKTYPNTDLKGDGQIVSVLFLDMIFEVLPAFLNKDGSYTFANSNNGGNWKVSNPIIEIEELKKGDLDCSGNLKQLCRMARAWRKEWDVPMSGLLIDTLAYKFIAFCDNKDKSFSYYDWISRDFFKYLSEQKDDQTVWLAPGSGQVVWNTGRFQYKAKRCYNIALEAIQYNTDKMPISAKSKWREIYGNKFPS